MQIRSSLVVMLALCAAPALAQQNAVTLSYTCNLGGLPAQLTARVVAVGDAGIVSNGRDITGIIGTGDYNLQYQGQLVSATSRYVFSGENAFADFTELTTNERFHVQFIAQGDQLLLIANPEGPQPARYLCQATRPAVPAQ